MRIGAVGELFGTDGVRGVANEDLTPEMALNLGRVMGTLRRKVAVAMDTRLSSPMLKSAVIAGLTSCGCDVVDLGVAPTPALQYYVKCRDVEGGVVITASHNPREYGGIKFIQDDGREFTRDMDEECERIYKSKTFKIASWDKIGQVYRDEYMRLYIDGILKEVDLDAIYDRGFKVVIDCGNGAGCVTSPQILRELGCEVISLNSHPDGRFSQRSPEPVEENLGLLKRVVKDVGADLGVAHDGDADRATFVDEKGRFVSEDVMLALMAKYYVEGRGGKVVTPVSSSKCVEDVVVEAGGEVIYTPVGSPVVAETMLKVKAVFGGEGNGGLIFPEHLLARDGAMSFAKVLELMALEKKPISELVKVIPKYHMIKTKVPCRDKIKLLKGLREMFPEANFTDGARIDYEDSWILIRPSGTEPIVRVFAEAKSRKKAKDLADFGVKVVKEILKE